ncbi:MAG: flagellar filament capping protein FliD [Comamonadaceae bacterium]|nr:flagellar filament capping protein FliD [Comamonadaceae bacterium]
MARVGADAEALINGTIIATGSNNTISDAIDGVTLTLSDADAAGISHKLTVTLAMRGGMLTPIPSRFRQSL